MYNFKLCIVARMKTFSYVPVEDLDLVPQAIAENKQMAREGIGLQYIGNQYHQPVDRLSHIRRPCRKIDTGI